MYRFFTLLTVLVLVGMGCNSVPARTVAVPPTNTQEVVESLVPTLQPVDAELAVRDYFNFIDDQNFQDAYAILSKEMQGDHPFVAWKEGYKDTLDHEIKKVDCDSVACLVTVVATESTTEDIHKTQYVLRYGVLLDVNGLVKIKDARLVSKVLDSVVMVKTIETLGSFPADPPVQTAPATTVKPIPVYQPPAPAAVPVPTPTPSTYCCKVCSTGYACGNSCISRSKTCHQPPGCACDG